MEKTNEFNQFDAVSDFSDHHYKRPDEGSYSNANSASYRAIMREWRILEQGLPDSIYVRVYEERIDLMRAVIVGAAGTPYHDGLFFFDIKFPSDYPQFPPQVSYHSFGLRLNPNLYHHGYVCLSLLNTWPGKLSEIWDEHQSTILQVLVSIQGLVLNEKPYFNEPGFDGFGRRFFHDNKSRAYNETAFTLTLKTSLHLLYSPPTNFEDFVKAHFRERGFMILDACDEYVTGRVRVGYYSCKLPSFWSRFHVSQEFKKTMNELYPRLLQQYAENGAPLALDRKLGQSKKKPNSNGSGIFNKVRRKIKQVLKWKKIISKKKNIEIEGKSDGGLQSA